MYSKFPNQPFYPYCCYDFRQTNIDKALACHRQNRWIRVTLRDGTIIEGFLSRYDFRGALIYVQMRKVKITCKGVSLDTAQKVNNCIGKKANLILPNNMSLSFKIEGVDQHGNIGGWLNFNELINMSSHAADVNCF